MDAAGQRGNQAVVGEQRAGRRAGGPDVLDAAMVAGHLIPAGSMFAFLAGHRAEVFPDAEYADMFAPPGVSRPSVPVTQMAAVLALQALHGFSDRETAEAVRSGVRWKVAIGAALDDAGPMPRRWCTGGGGSPGRRGRTGSTTRSARSWSRRGCWRGGGGGWQSRRCWRMRWPRRTP